METYIDKINNWVYILIKMSCPEKINSLLLIDDIQKADNVNEPSVATHLFANKELKSDLEM